MGGHPAAAALLVRDGKVAALGSEEELRAQAGRDAQRIDLAGGTITPGITDAHAHPTAWALARRRVELSGVPTVEEAALRVAAAARAGTEGWVLGQGWSQHLWGNLPTRQPLDHAVPARPVFLDSHDIHAAWLNSEALRRCGIHRDTPDPPGGRIVRDPATGEPTGVLLEDARRMALAHLPAPTLEEILSALADAQREAHALGVTGLHSVEATGLRDLEALRARGELRLRILQHVQLDQLDGAVAVGLRSGFGGEWIRVGGVKMFLDGALGSRTAWMREPYLGTGDRGIQTLAAADFRDAVRLASDAGISATVHAIGDAAVELALDVLEEIAPSAAMPHRIEHLQLCPPDLWQRAQRSGIVASMQPTHLLTDIPAAERHWGHERCRGAYAFAPLLHGGMTLAFGSDVPVETIDPRPGLFAARRRVPWSGIGQGEEGEWYPENRLTAAEALSAYTEGPARAAGESGRRGCLLPGYDADLAVWSVDPLAAEPEELLEMRCLLTMVGGEIVHSAAP